MYYVGIIIILGVFTILSNVQTCIDYHLNSILTVWVKIARRVHKII